MFFFFLWLTKRLACHAFDVAMTIDDCWLWGLKKYAFVIGFAIQFYLHYGLLHLQSEGFFSSCNDLHQCIVL